MQSSGWCIPRGGTVRDGFQGGCLTCRGSTQKPPDQCQCSLYSNLLRVVSDDLWQPVVSSDFACDANLLFLVVCLRILELAPIATPNHNRKDLVRIWLVKVKKGWLAFC